MMLVMLLEALGWSHCGPLPPRKRRDKNVRPMKAPKLENACLDRARRTRKRKSSRQKTLLIIRQYDTRLQPQHFLSMRQRVWWQQRVAQRTRSKEHEATNKKQRTRSKAQEPKNKKQRTRSKEQPTDRPTNEPTKGTNKETSTQTTTAHEIP